MSIKKILFPLLLLSVVLVSCTPYKMEIRQGNYVTSEMRAQLKTGMTKQQVRYVVGTAMINDPFHLNRWDYVFRLEQGGELVEQRGMTLYFEDDKLVRIADGELPVVAAPVETNQ
ncbi:MAG: outer membrane protein assembly factor BamE [Gallionella sp.]